jgi:hypothetical protein
MDHARARFPPPWSAEEADPELDRRCLIVRDVCCDSFRRTNRLYREMGRHSSLSNRDAQKFAHWADSQWLLSSPYF